MTGGGKSRRDKSEKKGPKNVLHSFIQQDTQTLQVHI